MDYHRAAKTHKLMFEQGRGRLKQLLIGQSFMVVTCSFLIAQLTAFPNLSIDVLLSILNVSNVTSSPGVIDTVFFIFVQSGLPGVIITVTFAQLLPSIFSKQYPLQFLNILGVHTTIRVALMIENIGIVKFVYVIFYGFKLFFNQISNDSRSRNDKDQSSLLDNSYHNIFLIDDDILEYEENESPCEDVQTEKNPPSNENKGTHNADTIPRGYFTVFMNIFLTFASFCLTVCSIIFLVYGVYHGFSTFGEDIHPALQFIILGFVLLIVFYCEGLKIAIVSTAHLDHVAVQAKGGNHNAVQIHQLLHPSPPANNEAFHFHAEGGVPGNDDTTGQDRKSPEVDHVKRFLLGR